MTLFSYPHRLVASKVVKCYNVLYMAKKIKLETKPNDYFIVIQIGGEKHEVSGATIPEALEKLNMGKFPGKISVTISHGEKTCRWELVKPIFFRKVLEYPAHKLLFEKRAKQFLGEIL